jgi:hypothetical protein
VAYRKIHSANRSIFDEKDQSLRLVKIKKLPMTSVCGVPANCHRVCLTCLQETLADGDTWESSEKCAVTMGANRDSRLFFCSATCWGDFVQSDHTHPNVRPPEGSFWYLKKFRIHRCEGCEQTWPKTPKRNNPARNEANAAGFSIAEAVDRGEHLRCAQCLLNYESDEHLPRGRCEIIFCDQGDATVTPAREPCHVFLCDDMCWESYLSNHGLDNLLAENEFWRACLTRPGSH